MSKTLEGCPLTPALLELLQTACDLNTLNQRCLAAALCKSPSTIDTMLTRIRETLEVGSATTALLISVRRGWITLR